MSYGEMYEIDLSGALRPWDGTGLPPIGCICWYGDKRLEARIITHIDQGESAGDMRFLAVGQLGELGPLAMAVDKHWYPIRTPEQIAEEEREKAVSEMVYGGCGCDQSDGTTTAFVICGLLYDAGYRKVAQ